MLRIVLTILRREIQLLLMVFVATGLMEMDPGKVLSIKSDWMLPLIWVRKLLSILSLLILCKW